MRGHGRGYGRVLLGGDVEMGMGMVCWALGGRGCAYGRGVGAGVGVGMASVVGRGHGREYGVDGYAGVDVNVDNTSRKRISHSSQRLTFVAPMTAACCWNPAQAGPNVGLSAPDF